MKSESAKNRILPSVEENSDKVAALLHTRAIALARESPPTLQQILHSSVEFVVSDMRFMIEMYLVREIVRNTLPISPLPFVPSFVLGLANVRGEVIPVIDLACFLGIKSTTNAQGSLIVLEWKELVVAFTCERIQIVHEICETEIQPMITEQTPILAEISNGYIKGGITVLHGEALMKKLKSALSY